MAVDWNWNVYIGLPVCVIIILFTTISNILVICAVLTYPPLKKSQNLLLVSLALADISCAVIVMPINVYWNVVGEWHFTNWFCMFHLASDSTLCTASILNLVAIALDRYWAIFDPINYTFKRTNRFIIIMALICWVLAALIVVIPALALPKIFEWPTDDCYFPSGFILYLTAGQFGIPLIIMCILYYLIYSVIKRKMRTRKNKCAQVGNVMVFSATSSNDGKSSGSSGQDTTVDAMEEISLDLKEMPSQTSQTSQNSRNSHTPNSLSVEVKQVKTNYPQFIKEKQKISISREKKAVKVLGIVVGVFVICWMPFFIMDNVYYVREEWRDATPIQIVNIIYWLGYVNSTCNPVIYTIFNRDFRKAFKKMLRIK